jgi:hypothetical protein
MSKGAPMAMDTYIPHSQAINIFLRSSNAFYGPIMTVWCNGKIAKKIHWDAFKMSDDHWQWMMDVRDILKVCNLNFECQHVYM